VALAAEAAGLAELWIWEDCFWEGGISLAGALLGMTERLRIGVGLLPYPLRNVALAADLCGGVPPCPAGAAGGGGVTCSGDYVRIARAALVVAAGDGAEAHLGATGPKSLRLNGRLADGTTLVSDTAPDQLAGIRALVAEGRAEAGRTDSHEFTVFAETTAAPAAATAAAWSAVGADRIALQPASDEADPVGFAAAAGLGGAARGT
jgi:hypothetical protein